MKSFLLLCFILTSVTTIAQVQNSLVGKWKTIEAFNGEVYFNLKTDSTFIKPEIKLAYPDTADEVLISYAKLFYGNFIFYFNADGTFKQSVDSIFQDEGKYKYYPNLDLLELTSKNSLGEYVTEKINCKIKNALLYLVMKMVETDLELVLEKL